MPPTLPFEIILAIIDSLVEFGSRGPPIALKPGDWRTVQLRQWSLVSKATHDTAARYLYTHCIWISSKVQLARLVRTLAPFCVYPIREYDRPIPLSSFRYLDCIASMYVERLGDSDVDKEVDFWWRLDHDHNDYMGDEIKMEYQAEYLFSTLCKVVGPRLRRLYINHAEKRSLIPWDQLEVGLLNLNSPELEEFGFVGCFDILDWPINFRRIVLHWPKLRCLALTMTVDLLQLADLLQPSKLLPSLQTIVIRPPRGSQIQFVKQNGTSSGQPRNPLKVVILPHSLRFDITPTSNPGHTVFYGPGVTICPFQIDQSVLKNRSVPYDASEWITERALQNELWTWDFPPTKRENFTLNC